MAPAKLVRKEWAYKATWLNGIQRPEGQMRSCSVKVINGADIEEVAKALDDGYAVTTQANMIEILNHYKMVKDINLSAAYNLNYFRPMVDMEV